MNQLEKLALDMEAITPYLLSGGAGALATGIAASQIKRDPKKSRMADLGRKLAIALGGGLAAAGIHKAVNVAGDSFSQALPAEDVATEERVTNVLSSPNLLRTGAGIGAGVGLYGHGNRADNKEFKSLMPGAGNPKATIKDLIKGQPEGSNKLKSWLDMHSSQNTPDSSAIRGLAAQELKATESLRDIRKSPHSSPNEIAEAKRKIAELSEKIRTQRAVDLGTTRNNFSQGLARAGMVEKDYEKGLLNTLKRNTRPAASRLLGKGIGGKITKPLTLAAALASPEIISKLTEVASDNPDK